MADKFVFRSTDSIGAAAAELDTHYLSECFVDTGALAILCDCQDPRRVLLGRTGAGKSALLARLADEQENVIQIKPESLALTYIANSNVLRFFAEAGVKMDIFYRLLWRHIFCVEILKTRFHIDNEVSKKSFLDGIWTLVPKRKHHEMALEYLRKWGESFWKETEYRIKEVTTTLEKDLESSVGGTISGVATLSGSAAKKLTEEQREEVVHRAQEVVNRVQIRELSAVIDLLGDVLLSDQQRRYYIIIDKLDENWVEDTLRFRLIRALIETSLDFAPIKNLKIVIALRTDLLDRVYRYTRDTGFQEEKYRTSCLELTWTPDQLQVVLDTRISTLVRGKYTNTEVTHKNVLPHKVGKQSAIKYMLDRTLLRPRDIIQFFNACIRAADGKPIISEKSLLEAEGLYSRERLRALADEWYGLYPNLLHLTPVLRNKSETFRLKELELSVLEDNCLHILVSGKGEEGIDLQYMKLLFGNGLELDEYRRHIVDIFYKVGLIGLKTESSMPMSWSFSGGVSVSKAEINDDTRLRVQQTFWRSLGIGSKIEDPD